MLIEQVHERHWIICCCSYARWIRWFVAWCHRLRLRMRGYISHVFLHKNSSREVWRTKKKKRVFDWLFLTLKVVWYLALWVHFYISCSCLLEICSIWFVCRRSRLFGIGGSKCPWHDLLLVLTLKGQQCLFMSIRGSVETRLKLQCTRYNFFFCYSFWAVSWWWSGELTIFAPRDKAAILFFVAYVPDLPCYCCLIACTTLSFPAWMPIVFWRYFCSS